MAKRWSDRDIRKYKRKHAGERDTKKPPPRKTGESALEEYFAQLLESYGLAKRFKRQYKFCEWRKFRADFADVENKIIVEINGGVWQGKLGGHTSPMGYTKDCERQNIMVGLGYVPLIYTSKVTMRKFMEDYQAILDYRRTAR